KKHDAFRAAGKAQHTLEHRRAGTNLDVARQRGPYLCCLGHSQLLLSTIPCRADNRHSDAECAHHQLIVCEFQLQAACQCLSIYSCCLGFSRYCFWVQMMRFTTATQALSLMVSQSLLKLIC